MRQIIPSLVGDVMHGAKRFLALGDSMSIDDYTGVQGGGAVNQFFRTLGKNWTLDDRTFDGCLMAEVPQNGRGDLITLTIGGNDLLCNREKYRVFSTNAWNWP